LCDSRLFRNNIHVIRRDIQNLIIFSQCFGETTSRRYNRDTWSEWLQSLAEQVMDREKKLPPVPAYIAHRDWKKL
jgi:hypothetical protein